MLCHVDGPGAAFWGDTMLAILGLLGLALAATAFVDLPSAQEDEDPVTDTDDDLFDGDFAQSFLSEDVASDAGAGQDAPDDLINFSAPLDDLPGGQTDDFLGTDADDVAEGGDGLDVLLGGAGDDELNGGRDDDLLDGGFGDDTLYGAVGDDQLFGEAGNDTLIGGEGDDLLNGGEGDDVLNGSYGNDSLTGGYGADMLNGGDGNDTLDGGDDAEKDYLNGGDGDDRLIARLNDHLNGGTGADTFVLDDAIMAAVDDFNPDEDVIELGYDDTPPALSTQLGDDGLVLLADGEVVATFPGLQSLDVAASVRLVAL